MTELMTLMEKIVKYYNDYAGRDGDASSLTMKEMSQLFMKELHPWMLSLNDQTEVDQTEVDRILESYHDDIEAGIDFAKFGKLLIEFANVIQKTGSKDKLATLGST